MSEDGRAWIPGVTTPLPPGERVRWQGAPAPHALARRAFHVRKIAGYFALLLVWRAAASVDQDSGLTYFLAGATPLLLLAGLCIGCSFGLARWTQRTTVYAVTDRRVVFRIGLVLQSTINIPFRQIQGASVRLHPDGTGDIALRLGERDRLAYLMLWPHARAWYLSHPQPTLRCVPDAQRIAVMLQEGVVALADGGTAVDDVPMQSAPRGERVAGLPAEALA